MRSAYRDDQLSIPRPRRGSRTLARCPTRRRPTPLAAFPALQRKPGQLPKEKVKTEAQAAERVAQLTKMLLQSKAAAAAATPTAAAVTLPPLPPVPTESPARCIS